MGNNQSQEVKKDTVVVVEPVNTQTIEVKAEPVIIVQSTPAQPAQKPFSFKQNVQCVTNSLLGIGPWIHTKKTELSDNQLVKTCNQTRASFKSEVQVPLCNLYNTIPEKFTQAKFELISPYSYNQRFTALNILCAVTAIGTITSTRGNPVSRILRSTRNAGFMYLLGGLLIAPEVYNPFIRDS